MAEKSGKAKYFFIVVACVLVVAMVIGALYLKETCDKKSKYGSAVVLANTKEYDRAIGLFMELGDYEDSLVMLKRISADKLYDAGDYAGAYAIYRTLDSAYQTHEADYAAAYDAAEDLSAEGNYALAAAAYQEIAYYSDSADKALECLYLDAAATGEKGDYAAAGEKYLALGDYKDSADKALECLYLDAAATGEKGDYAAAGEKYLALADYRDSAERAVQAEADGLYAAGDYAGAYAIYRTLDSAYRTHEADYAAAYDAAGDLAAEGNYALAATAYQKIAYYSDSADKALECLYLDAAATGEKGDYAAAGEKYLALGNYKDSADKAREAYHALGGQLLASGDIEGAEAAYTAANGYGDSAERLTAISTYREAQALEKEGSYLAARDKYNGSGIADSAERAEACCQAAYEGAEELYRKGDIAGAYDAFTTLGDYSDSAEKARAIGDSYQAAKKAEDDGAYEDAIAGYTALGNFGDAEERILSANYAYAMKKWADGDREGAEACLAAAGNYSDAAEQMAKLRTELAEDCFAAGDFAGALAWYALVPQTDDVMAREYAIAQAAYDAGEYATAVTAYEALGYYGMSANRLPVARYVYASRLFDEGEYVAAAEQFALLGDISDAEDRIKACNYQEGMRLLESAEYDAAKYFFNAAGANWSDAADMAKECDYRKACALLEEGSYTEARALFSNIKSYKDGKAKADECDYRLAQEKLDNGKYAAAEEIFRALGSYGDSAEKAKLCVYRQAEIARDAGRYEEADEKFTSVSGYEDSAGQAAYCRYCRAEEKYAEGDYAEALALYQTIDYADSAEKSEKCNIALGDAALSKTYNALAARYYYRALPNEAAQEKLYGMGRDYVLMNMYPEAIVCLYACGEYEPAQALLGELAEKLADAQPVPALICCEFSGQADKAAVLWETVTYEQVEAYTADMDPELAPELAQLLRYRYAAYLNAAGEYDAAYAAYETITGYGDVDTIIETDKNIAAAAARAAYLPSFWVGNTVTLGTYAGEPIEWIVLAEDGDDRLLIAKYGIEAKAYNTEEMNVTWETCSLRAWLNGEFYLAAFTEDEKKLIALTDVKNDDNLTTGAEGGNDTLDYVYLMSIDEVNRYFADTGDRICYPTAYAKENGAYTNSNGAGRWWLRSPGSSGFFAADVNGDGYIFTGGNTVCHVNVCVRPVVVVRLTGAVNAEEPEAQGVEQTGDAAANDVPDQAEDKTEGAITETWRAGDIVTFGSYEQDGNKANGAEPIEWIVLEDRNNEEYVVLSRYALEMRPFNTVQEDVTWEDCSLRKWLNEDFYGDAFTDAEKAVIQKTEIVTSDKPYYKKNVEGIATEDYVYLLSIDEAKKYLPTNDDRVLYGTAYYYSFCSEWVRNNYEVLGVREALCWDLRSAGYYSTTNAFINSSGVIYSDGGYVETATAVRPVIVLKHTAG